MHNECVAYVMVEFIPPVCSVSILPRAADMLVSLVILRQGEKMTRRTPSIAQDIASGTMSVFLAINPWE